MMPHNRLAMDRLTTQDHLSGSGEAKPLLSLNILLAQVHAPALVREIWGVHRSLLRCWLW